MKRISILLLFLGILCLNAQTKPFEPDGYYFPVKKIVIAGHVISSLDVRTLDYSFEDTTHVLQSKAIEPEVFVSIVGARRRAKGYNVMVTNDSLCFYFYVTPLDRVEFRGEFLDKRGRYDEQSDITPLQTVIVKGIFSLFKKGKLKTTWNANLTFWQGD
jgi:hypothetical protein